MLKLRSLRQQAQPVVFRKGDWVRYIGFDTKVQYDYGNQDLRILAIDLIHGIAICENTIGQCLVGVSFGDLQRMC